MENNTDDSTIRVPFNWQFVYNNTSFPEKFEQHLRTLSPGLEEETVRSITKRYIIEKCKSNPFWMAENVGEIRLDLLKSETAMTLNDIKQSTKIMPGRITETNSEASQTHSKPSALNKGSINKHIQKASDNGPSREESQKTSHIEFLPKDLCFDDFLRFTNLESYVKADIVSKNKQNSGKFLRQLDKYLKRHYAVFIKRNKWPKAIQFNDDSIRTLEDFIRMKKLYEKNALDKEKITTESPDMFLCSSESKSGENLKTKTNTCTSPIVLSDDDSLSSLNIQNPQLVEKASMVKIVSKATSKTTPKKTISSPEKTNGITKTQEGQRSDKQPSTSKTQNPKSNDRATKKNIQSEVDSNSSSKDRKRDRVDERCNKCPPTKKMKRAPNIKFLPRDLCFADFLNFTNFESYVKADILAKNKENSHKFMAQLDKYLRKHYGVFVKFKIWPIAIQFHDATIQTLDDFKRAKKQYQEKKITLSPDMFPSSNESKTDKSENNFEADLNRVLDGLDGTCKVQLLVDLLPNTSELSSQKSPDNRIPQYGATCPDNEDAITERFEKPEGAIFIDPANMTRGNQPPMSPSQDPLAITTASDNVSEMNVSSIMSDASHDTTVILNPASQPACPVEDVLPFEAEAMNSIVNDDVSGMTPYHNESISIECDPSENPFSKETLDALHDLIHSMKEYELNDFNLQQEQVQSRGVAHDRSTESADDGTNEVSGETENNNAKLVPPPSQRSVENGNLEGVEIKQDNVYGSQPDADVINTDSDSSVIFVPNETTIDLVDNDADNDEDTLLNLMMAPCMNLSISIEPPSQMPFTMLHVSRETLAADKDLSGKSIIEAIQTNDANSTNIDNKSTLMSTSHNEENLNSTNNTLLNKMMASDETTSTISTPSAVGLMKSTVQTPLKMTSTTEGNVRNQSPSIHTPGAEAIASSDGTCTEDQIGINESSTPVEKNFVTNSASVDIKMDQKMEAAQSSAGKKVGSLNINNNIEQVSDRKNINSQSSEFQMPIVKKLKTNTTNWLSKKGRKRKCEHLVYVDSTSKKPRKMGQLDEIVDPQLKRTFEPLALALTSTTSQMSLTEFAAQESHSYARSCRNDQLALGIDLHYFIEDVSQCNVNPSSLEIHRTNISQVLSEDNSHCEENTGPNAHMPLLRIVTELGYNWLTHLDVESIPPDTIISHLVYKSTVVLFSSISRKLLHAICRISNTKNVIFEINTNWMQFTFNVNSTDEERLIRLLHTLQYPSISPSCARADLVAVNGLRCILDYFEEFSAISILEEDNQNTQSQACSDDDDVRTVIFEIPEGAEMIDPMNISIHNRTNPPKQEPLAIAAEQLIPSVPSHSSTVIQNPETRNMPADVKKSTDRPDVMCATPSQDDSKNIKFEPSNNQITTDADLAVLRALVCMLNEQNGEVKSSADDYKTLFNLEPGRVEALRAAINESTECHEGVDVVSEETKSNIAILAALSQQSVCVNDNEDCKRDNGANSEIANNSDIIFVPNERNTTIVIEDDDTTSLLLNMMCVESETLLTEENQPRESIIENSELNKSATGANSTNIENNSIVVPAAHSAENLNSTKDILLNKTSENSLSESLIANTVQTPATLAENCNGDSANHENVPIQALHIQTLPPEAMCSEDVACIDERIGINESIEMAPSSTQNNIVQDCASMKMKSVASNVEVGSVNINNNLEPVSDHGNRKKSPSEFQVPFAVPLTRSKSVKRVETGGLNRKQKNPETKKGNKRKAQHAASSKSKKPRKADQPDETTGVSQEKHIFPPLALVVTSRTSQTCLTVPTAKESHSKTPSCRNTENASGIDLDYFIEDVSQCDPSPPQTQPTNISQMLSEDETFLRNLNCTTMKTTHSASAVECSNDKSDSQCEENTEQNTDMPVLRIVTERGYNWFTQLDVESIPGTIISQLIYRSSFALLSPGGKRQTHATCAKKNLTYFLFKIASSRLQFSFNANDADKGRLARILHTLQHPSISPSCPRSDLVAVNGLRSILDYFEEFSAISILEEAIKNAKKKSSVSANSKNTISPQNIDYETFRYGTNIESIFRRRICRKYGDRQTVYLEILETIIQRYYEDHFRVLNKWPAKIKFRDVRIQLPRIKWDGQRKINMSKWFQVYDMKRWERDILKGLIAKKCVA